MNRFCVRLCQLVLLSVINLLQDLPVEPPKIKPRKTVPKRRAPAPPQILSSSGKPPNHSSQSPEMARSRTTTRRSGKAPAPPPPTSKATSSSVIDDFFGSIDAVPTTGTTPDQRSKQNMSLLEFDPFAPSKQDIPSSIPLVPVRSNHTATAASYDPFGAKVPLNDPFGSRASATPNNPFGIEAAPRQSDPFKTNVTAPSSDPFGSILAPTDPWGSTGTKPQSSVKSSFTTDFSEFKLS